MATVNDPPLSASYARHGKVELESDGLWQWAPARRISHPRQLKWRQKPGRETDMPKTIAIVEDEAAIRDNYAAALSRHGFKVLTFAARQEASEAFQLRLPDLVIIDITLGDETDGGFELCRELRARAAHLPIVFLTARDSELDAVSGLRLGADDYLTKNIGLAHLAARVSALLQS